MKIHPQRGGLTLIELLLVMGLLAVLLGAGLGSLASLNPAERAAVGVVQDALRSAHNSAIARGATARVFFDANRSTLRTEGLEVVGTWHFEDSELTGAEGMAGTFVGMAPTLAQEGWIGAGLDFRGAPRGAEVEFPIQDDPVFDLSRGFAIDFALRPDSLASARLLAIPGVLEIEMEGDGSLTLSLFRRTDARSPEPGRTTATRSGAGLTLTSRAGVLRPERWCQLRFTYDHESARILVDGIEVGRLGGDFDLAPLEASLRLAGGATPPPAILDELTISAVVASELIELPGDVIFVKPLPPRVQFGPGGALDPRVHRAPVTLFLEFAGGRREQVRVGLYGSVE